MAGDDGFDAEAWLARQLGQEPNADEPKPAVPPEPPPAAPPTEPPPAAPPAAAPPAASPSIDPPPTEPAPVPPPLVEPAAPAHPDIPTQAMSLADMGAAAPPSEPPPLPSRRELRNSGALDPALQGTEVLGVPDAVGMPVPPGEGHEVAPPAGQDLDALFGASAFQEYDDAIIPAGGVPRKELAIRDPGAPPRPGIGKTQKVLLWVAGGLVGVLALIALFLVGTRISTFFGPSPAVIETPSPTPTPSATALPAGPLAPGTYAWDELLGTECLEPYESPWQETYTVVDCAEPHAAQLVRRGTFTEDTAYPGEEELVSRMNLLCTDPTAIDYAATAGITDLQFAASYAASAAEWEEGHHDYFCFVNRAGGTALTGSIAKPPAPPAP